jgi:hypothetical protein
MGDNNDAEFVAWSETTEEHPGSWGRRYATVESRVSIRKVQPIPKRRLAPG